MTLRFVFRISLLQGYIFEIACFFSSKWLLEKFGSFYLLMAAQVMMIVRFVIHSTLPHGKTRAWVIWSATFAEVLKGINLGLMQAAGVLVYFCVRCYSDMLDCRQRSTTRVTSYGARSFCRSLSGSCTYAFGTNWICSCTRRSL